MGEKHRTLKLAGQPAKPKNKVAAPEEQPLRVTLVYKFSYVHRHRPMCRHTYLHEQIDTMHIYKRRLMSAIPLKLWIVPWTLGT